MKTFLKARVLQCLVFSRCSHQLIELIGEEIYDEFDPHYHPFTDSANGPDYNNLDNLAPATGHDIGKGGKPLQARMGFISKG